MYEKAPAELSTPRWQFIPETVSWSNDLLREIGRCDLLIIDELGPLEFLRGEGLMAGMRLVDNGNYRVACVVVRSSLVPKALQRWPEASVVSGFVENLNKKRDSQAIDQGF